MEEAIENDYELFSPNQETQMNELPADDICAKG